MSFDSILEKFHQAIEIAFNENDYNKMQKLCEGAIKSLKGSPAHVGTCYSFQCITYYLRGKKEKARQAFKLAVEEAAKLTDERTENEIYIFKHNHIEFLVSPLLDKNFAKNAKRAKQAIAASDFLLTLLESYPTPKYDAAVRRNILMKQADAYLFDNQKENYEKAYREAKELGAYKRAEAFVEEALHKDPQEDEVDYLEEKMSISLEELTREMVETNEFILRSGSMIKQLETAMRQAEEEEVKSLASSVSSSVKPELSSVVPVAKKKLVPIPQVLPPKLTGKLSNAERERRRKEKQLEKKKEKEQGQLLQQQIADKKIEKESKPVKRKDKKLEIKLTENNNAMLDANYEFIKTLLPQTELDWLGELYTRLAPLNKSLQITGEFAAACAIYVYTKQTIKINQIHLLVAQHDEAKPSSISGTDSVIVGHGFEGIFSDATSFSNYSCLRMGSLEQTPYQYMLTLPFRTEYKPPFDPLDMNRLRITVSVQSASDNLSFPLCLNKNLFFNLKDNNSFRDACAKGEFKSQLPSAEEKCAGLFFKVSDWRNRTKLVFKTVDSKTRNLLSLNNNNWATQFFIRELFKKPSFGSSGVFNFSCYYQIVALMRHPDFASNELKATIHAFCRAIIFAKQYREKFPSDDLSIMSNQAIHDAVINATLNLHILDNMTKVIQGLYQQPIFKKWNDRDLHKHLTGVMEEMCKDNRLSKLLSPEDFATFIKKHTPVEKLIEQKEQVSSVNLKKGK